MRIAQKTLQATSLALLVGFSLVFAPSPTSAQHVQVVDGDTIIVDGLTYRLDGVDAPEAGQKCNKSGGGTWMCGNDAIKTLMAATAGKRVTCDYRELGDYHRTLAVCHAGKLELNRLLVQKGLAWAFKRTRTNIYLETQRAARAAGLGIWQASTQTAEEYRTATWAAARKGSPTGCPIKGEIADAVQIYHTPWSPAYASVKIDKASGERWFCSEAAAIRAGWRVPYWGK